MEFQKAIQAVHRGDLFPVYILQGSETFLINEFRQSLASAVEKSAGELDLTTIDVEESGWDQVLDEAEMYSFFVDQRLIIADHIDFICSQPSQKLTDSQQTRLLEYLDNPNPASHLLLVIPHDQIDKRRKITKALIQKGQFIDTTPLGEKEVHQYIQSYLQEEEFKISREAVQEILIRTGYQLSQSIAEIQKLKQFAVDGKSITIEVVRTLVTRSLESDVFELTNAVLAKDANRAIQIYRDLILMKHEPIQLHALIVSQFRLFIQVKLMQKQGLMQGDIAQVLSVHPYRVKLAMQASRRMDIQELAILYESLIEADFRMKIGVGQKETYFYLILTKILQL